VTASAANLNLLTGLTDLHQPGDAVTGVHTISGTTGWALKSGSFTNMSAVGSNMVISGLITNGGGVSFNSYASFNGNINVNSSIFQGPNATATITNNTTWNGVVDLFIVLGNNVTITLPDPSGLLPGSNYKTNISIKVAPNVTGTVIQAAAGVQLEGVVAKTINVSGSQCYNIVAYGSLYWNLSSY